MTDTPASTVLAPPLRPTLLPLILTLLGVTVFMVLRPPPRGYSVSMATGWGIGYALAAFALLYFTVLRKSGRKVGWLYFLIIAAWCGLACGLFGLGSAAGHGGAGLTQEAHDYMARAQAQITADQATSAAIGPVLDPNRIRSAQDIPAARDRLARLRQLVARSHDDFLQRQGQERARIAARWPGSLAEFDGGVARSRPLLDERMAAQAANYDVISQVIDFLQRTSSRWHVADGAWVFEDHADADEFQRLAAQVTAAAQRVRAAASAQPVAAP